MKKAWFLSIMALVLFSFALAPSTSFAFYPILFQPRKVEVVNDDTNPVPVVVKNQLVVEKIPVSLDLGSFSTSGSGTGFNIYHSSASYTVPDGYLLVIEQVFFKISVPEDTDGVLGDLVILTTTGSGANSRDIPFTLVDQGLNYFGAKNFIASQPMKLYIHPVQENEIEKEISLRVTVTGGLTPQIVTQGNLTLCGYLEEMP